MPVYIAPEVAEVLALHPYVIDPSFRSLTIREQIVQQAEVVHAAHAAKDQRIRMQVMSWWPGAQGVSLDDVMQSDFSTEDSLLTLSREYGFRDWDEAERFGSVVPPSGFEAALDLLLLGDREPLQAMLEGDPDLATATSAYGHRATLLHYLGANGVESHRQQTPLNAAEMATLLIDRGADRTATATMYGGGQTAHRLARTSAHPHNAGIVDALLDVLT